jgi:hypothetical protein
MLGQYPHLVIVRIPEHIEPMDRGDRYEDPLDAKLKESGLGEVTGGGSQLDENFKSFMETSQTKQKLTSARLKVLL